MALYATIWLALALLVTAEFGKRAQPGALWIRLSTILGGLLAIAHALLAFDQRYNWNHGLAVIETARQAESVYGFGWRGSIYVNYVFLALWLTVAWRWRHWAWRTFVLIMVVNGAIVFARPWARLAGAMLVALLIWAWRRRGLRLEA